jgi:hypothetical protein
MDILKDYQCQRCGNTKKVMVNHDGLPTLWERCTDRCMWTNDDKNAPVLLSVNGEKTGFKKTLHKRINNDRTKKII